MRSSNPTRRSLLLWKGKGENFDALAWEHVYAYTGSYNNREHIVLDGQQRLTAMHYAFVGGLPALQKHGAQRKSRHWYWASVFTNRYSGAVESTSARDFLEQRKWIQDDVAEPILIEDFKLRVKTRPRPQPKVAASSLRDDQEGLDRFIAGGPPAGESSRAATILQPTGPRHGAGSTSRVGRSTPSATARR